MAPSEERQQYLNPAPPSFSAGGHETRDYYTAQDASRPFLHDEPYLTPYLGLRARLSQTWINRWTILLLLVLIRTLFAIASLDDSLGSARKEALSMCISVENVGSAMASMPHYMSQGINDLTAKGIEKAIDGLMQGLILTVTGVEQMVVFVINLLTSTYLCLITLAVSGSLHVAVSVAEDVGNFLNSTVKDIGGDLGAAEKSLQDTINDFVSGLDNVANALTGSNSKPPQVDLSNEINKLNSLQLPANYDQGLQKLNSSIPTFTQVQNFTNTVIELPFEEVKKLLNESLPRYSMNDTIFPVPAKKQLTFCSDNDGVNDFFDDLVEIERMARKVFLIVIVIAAILAMLPMAYRDLRRYHFMKARAKVLRRSDLDAMDKVYMISRPYTSAAGQWLASKTTSRGHVGALVRWSVAYATTVPALFVLSLALAGLLACLCQYILLKAIEKEVPVLENEVIGFVDKVIDSLNNASEEWAVGTNKVISQVNNDINHDVLGWVNTTTTAVNNTLNVFVDDMIQVLNVTFGGTILYNPILDVLNCLVILKIEGIEKGLSWVSDHAHVNFPLLPNDTFSLGTLQKVSGSSTDLLATGPNGTAADAITGAVNHVTNLVAKTIRQEAIISTCVLLVWVIIALIGVGRSIFVLVKGGPHKVFKGTDNYFGEKESREILPEPSPSYTETTSSNSGVTEICPRDPNQLAASGYDAIFNDSAEKQALAAATPVPAYNGANKLNGRAYTLTTAKGPVFDPAPQYEPRKHGFRKQIVDTFRCRL